MSTMRYNSTNPAAVLFAGISGGVLAGAIVGLLETLYLWMSSGAADSLSALWFAVLSYGAVGFGIALVWTIIRLHRKLPANISWLDCMSVMVPLLLFSIALFRIRRDLLQESVAWNQPAGWLLMAAALICLSVTFLLLRRLLRSLARRGILVVSWGITFVLLLAGTFLMTLNPSGPGPVNWPKESWKGEGGLPPNVLLIIVDTLRDDYLIEGSPYKVDTPNIDMLSASGVRFVNCRAQASKTRPSVASILTSLYPSTHGCERKIHGLPPDIPHFPELLGKYGYATVGLINNINLTPFFGFDRGFGEYRYLEPALYFAANDAGSNLVIYGTLRRFVEKLSAGTLRVRHYYWEAGAVADLAVDWLESSPPEPFFLWVYLMDPHDPYFEHPYNGNATARVVTPNPSPERLPLILEQYRAEIRYTDQQVGRILNALEATGKASNTVVIFTADHGEEFLEHGGWWHGTTLYREVLNVPLIFRLPRNQFAGSIRSDPVMGVDIAPTVLEVIGIPYPDSWEGIPLFTTEADSQRIRMSEVDHEGNQVKTINQGDWIWIEANPDNPRGLPTHALFNLAEDPGEIWNVADAKPQIAQTMRDNLIQIRTRALSKKGVVPELTIDQATEERLRALGYTK
jgi:arylsulfatase A-like enzyme